MNVTHGQPLPEWGTGEADAQAIYLTDMDVCTPATALTRQHHQWRRVDYETETLSGVMLTASYETTAPRVTYPLRANGWHAISIGVHRYESEPRSTYWSSLIATGPSALSCYPRTKSGAPLYRRAVLEGRRSHR